MPPFKQMLYSRGGMPTVFVIAKDWTLRAGVRAQLRADGVNALGMESAEDAARMLAQGTAPSAVVLEASDEEAPSGLEVLARRVPVVVVASRAQRVKVLSNAAAVLYRPVRVAEVVTCVENLLRGQAA